MMVYKTDALMVAEMVDDLVVLKVAPLDEKMAVLKEPLLVVLKVVSMVDDLVP